jgi:hypothetical protein
VHRIHGEREGENIIIDIRTPCRNIRKMSRLVIPVAGLEDIRDNYVMEKAHESQCTPTCLVPCAVLHVAQMEAGMLPSPAGKTGEVSISFIE